MPSTRVSFLNRQNLRLAGMIDWPRETPQAFALFSHCFTCTKDLKSIVKISRRLAQHGVAVLRFDFTGLGESEGTFADTNFETNLDDIQAAADWLAQEHQPPSLLIGHSLGGAAMMVRCDQIESAVGLVTLAAPSCTQHLARLLTKMNPQIIEQGEGTVQIGGPTYLIRRQMVDCLEAFDLKAAIRAIRLPHLIFHSPVDQTLGWKHADEIFSLTGGPKSLITLDGADHLIINQRADAPFVGDVIHLWLHRMLMNERG